MAKVEQRRPAVVGHTMFQWRSDGFELTVRLRHAQTDADDRAS